MEDGEVTLHANLRFGGAVPIVGLTSDQSTALITNLVFSSLWMGALGWELLMTVHFDFRLARQTNWRSVASSIHSLAYYTSRYSTIAFIVLYVVINSVSVSLEHVDMCERRVTASAAMFVLSQCSVLLVFVMRTIALWNLNVRVCIPLVLFWLACLGINVTIPVYGKGVAMENFCIWTIDGAWVGASMIAMALTAFLCLVLTIVKLNKQGWRGLLQSMMPSTTRSIDAEDVSRVLVQRTTCFFVVMLASIIIADVVYFTVDFALWQLIGVPAYLAIASSLAGRLFRRSWKMTRSAEYNRPPSYDTNAWRNRAGSHEDGGHGEGSRHQASLSPYEARTVAFADPFAVAAHRDTINTFNRSDEAFSFVEGQFRGLAPFPALSVKSLHSQGEKDDKTEVSFADAQRRRASEPAYVASRHGAMQGAAYGSDEDEHHTHLRQVVVDVDGTNVKRKASTASMGAFAISEVPAFTPRSVTTPRSLSSRGGGSSHGNPPPFGVGLSTPTTPKSIRKTRAQRPATEPNDAIRDHPSAANSKRATLAIGPQSLSSNTGWHQPLLTPPGSSSSRPDTASSSEEPSVYIVSRHPDPRWSSLDVSTMPAINGITSSSLIPVRDDLAAMPHQPRLWIDSGAERARMEAAVNSSAARLGEIESNYAASSHASTSSLRASSHGTSRRGTSSKRMILESAHEAGEDLSQKGSALRGRRRRSEGMMAAVKEHPNSNPTPPYETSPAAVPRSAYLASPAIISTPATNDSLDRSTYDLDAIRVSMMNAALEHERSPVSVLMEKSVLSRSSANGITSQSRPRTAPSKVNESERREGWTEGANADDDPMDAFRNAVDEDIERRFVDDRPRTSRGGTLGAFGQQPAGPPVRDGSPSRTMRRTSSMHEDRPKTRSGVEQEGSVKPFGSGSEFAQQAALSSAIEEQYRRLHVLANSNQGRRAEEVVFSDTTSSNAAALSSSPLERIDSRSTEENLP